MSHRRFIFALTVSGAVGAVASVILWFSATKERSLERLQREGIVRIGYAIEAPYAFLDADGNVTGESPEIAREIARRLGIGRVEWRLTEFSMLIDELETRQFELIAAGMFISEERRRRVAFSKPTFAVGSALLVRRGNPLQLTNYASAAATRISRLAVLSGSVEEQQLIGLGTPSERLFRVPDALTGKALVLAGKADALALSAPSVRWMARDASSNQVECVELQAPDPRTSSSTSLGAFVFRRSDRSLIAAWNRALDEYLGSDEHRRCVARFQFTSNELPPSARAPSQGNRP